jgi:hypothetical protein
MRALARIAVLIAATALASTGCQNHQNKVDGQDSQQNKSDDVQSHQAKLDELQKEHDRVSRQYQKDCGSEYLKANPQFNQKCKDESKQMDDAWKKLQEEKAK